MATRVSGATRPTLDAQERQTADVSPRHPLEITESHRSQSSDISEGVSRYVKFGAILLVLGLIVDQLRILLSFGILHTDEDQTILWYAGREILSGRFYEPNFFGQTYNTNFEAIPGALLHVVGLPWSTAMPLATTLLVTMTWIVMAFGAYRRGHPLAALLALAAPLIMRVQYLLLFDAPRGVISGDLVAAIAVAIAIRSSRTQIRLSSLVGLGGLAVFWDMAAALLIVPALVYFVCLDWRTYKEQFRRTLSYFSVALLPPMSWFVFTDIFYRSHHEDLIAPTVSTVPHWTIFLQNIGHIDVYLNFFAPALTPIAGLATLLLLEGFVLIVVIAIRRRSLALFLASCTLVALVCFALSLQRSTDVFSGLYISGPRLLLPLPFAVWFLAWAIAHSNERSPVAPNSRSRGIRHKAVAIVAFAALSVVAAQFTFARVAAHAVKPDVRLLTGVWERNPAQLTSECTELTEVYDSTGAQLLATINLNVAYGCAAEDGLQTLSARLDRRGWAIEAAFHRPIRRILLQVPNCRLVSPAAGICTPEAADLVLLRTPLTPAATSLDKISGMHVHEGSNPGLSSHR